jgi:hypothetical protein
MICDGSIPTVEQERATRSAIEHFISSEDRSHGSRHPCQQPSQAVVTRAVTQLGSPTRVHRAEDEDHPAEDVPHMVPHS